MDRRLPILREPSPAYLYIPRVGSKRPENRNRCGTLKILSKAFDPRQMAGGFFKQSNLSFVERAGISMRHAQAGVDGLDPALTLPDCPVCSLGQACERGVRSFNFESLIFNVAPSGLLVTSVSNVTKRPL